MSIPTRRQRFVARAAGPAASPGHNQVVVGLEGRARMLIRLYGYRMEVAWNPGPLTNLQTVRGFLLLQASERSWPDRVGTSLNPEEMMITTVSQGGRSQAIDYIGAHYELQFQTSGGGLH